MLLPWVNRGAIETGDNWKTEIEKIWKIKIEITMKLGKCHKMFTFSFPSFLEQRYYISGLPGRKFTWNVEGLQAKIAFRGQTT